MFCFFFGFFFSSNMGFEEFVVNRPYVNTRKRPPSKRSLKKFKIYTLDTPINTSLNKMSRTFDLRY